jgi:ribonuclease J
MLTNTRIARELGYLNVPDNRLIDAYDAKDIPARDIVVLCTGSQGEPLSALARMANGEHRTVPIESGDVVIISASPVPGNEKAVTRVINGLSRIGADVYDRSRALVHVSGHAGPEELKLMMVIARPKSFMPVHGEVRHLRAHAKLAEDVGISRRSIFVLDNGDCLMMEDGQLRRGEPVESGIVYVDGLSVGDISAVVLKDRQTLASDGVVTVVCQVRGRDGQLVGRPEVIMRGVAGAEDNELYEILVNVAESTIADSASGKRMNSGQLRRNLRERISATLWGKSRRRPMVIPLILEV